MQKILQSLNSLLNKVPANQRWIVLVATVMCVTYYGTHITHKAESDELREAFIKLSEIERDKIGDCK